MARKTLRAAAAIGLVALTLTTSCAAQAQEKEAGKIALPEAAAAALKKALPKATFHEVEQEREDRTTIYIVAFRQNGQEGEVVVAPDGTIVEVYAEGIGKGFPEAVANTILRLATGARLEAVGREEVRAEARGEKFVTLATPRIRYWAALVKNGREFGITVAADGTVLEIEVGDDEEENEDEFGDEDDDEEDDEDIDEEEDQDEEDDEEDDRGRDKDDERGEE